MNDECRRCWKAWWNDPMDVGKWEALVEADRKARSEENRSGIGTQNGTQNRDTPTHLPKRP